MLDGASGGDGELGGGVRTSSCAVSIEDSCLGGGFVVAIVHFVLLLIVAAVEKFATVVGLFGGGVTEFVAVGVVAVACAAGSIVVGGPAGAVEVAGWALAAGFAEPRVAGVDADAAAARAGVVP